jgi:hypothetical protein
MGVKSRVATVFGMTRKVRSGLDFNPAKTKDENRPESRLPGCFVALGKCFGTTTLGFVADSVNFFHKSSCQMPGKVL